MKGIKMSIWDEKWQQLETPWDLGGPHPRLEMVHNHLESLGLWPKSGRAYIPACGRCHDGAYLASLNLEVLGTDIVAEAVEAAQIAYKDLAGLSIKKADHFEVDNPSEFDLVFDRAALCAFAPDAQEKFLDCSFARLKPGGLYISMAFGEIEEGVSGPPFALADSVLQKMLQLGSLVLLEDHPNDGKLSKIKVERVLVVRTNP